MWGGTSYLDEVIAGLDTAALTRPNYSLVLRNNILKYGTFQATYNYYIYNDSDTALSTVQFWFGRKSCSWKRVAFTTPLHKLNIETFDAVTLNLSECASAMDLFWRWSSRPSTIPRKTAFIFSASRPFSRARWSRMTPSGR